MHVQLDFEQEGVHYQVIRRRSRNKRSSTGTLDLLVRNAEGTLVTMSEPNMRATQEKINALLRLDYETFVHSAFLQQGKADAFTTQTPAKRKQILSDILGLGQWEQYEDRVKEQLKRLERDLLVYEARIQEINDKIAQKPALEAEQAEALAIHAEARAALQLAQAHLDAIKDAPAALKNAREKQNEHQRRTREYQRDLDALADQIARQQKQIDDYLQIVANKDEIEGGYAALQSARDADQSFNAKLTDLIDLDKRRAELNTALSTVRTRLESERDALTRSISTHETLIAAQPADELEALQEEVSALKHTEAEREALLEAENHHRETRASLEAQLKATETEGKTLSERLKTLQAAGNVATCPLCGQPLEQAAYDELIAQIERDRDAHRTQYKQLKEALDDVATALKTHKSQLNALDKTLTQLPALLENAGRLQAQVAAADQAALRLNEDQQRIEAIEATLADQTYAPEVFSALAALDQEQTALGYDKSTHDATRRSLDEYRRYEALQTRLAMAQEALPTLEEALAGSHLRHERLTAALEEVAEAEIALEIEIAGLQVQVEEYTQREQEVRLQHTRERNAYERLVKAQQSLSALEEEAIRKLEYENRREKLRHEEGIYKELRTAFGKNGIPAMIIETAIPELEATSNEILGRMTDGRMGLRLQTQKEKVTGGVAETLDIEIADELGTRNYELYSGGEAFRINFAIRVALSQMLARRAGAHLRTLFIDEGFGTQDDSGRGKLVEAINAIQDDFDLILVITHIDELRDSFPVHIVVEKTQNGSRVSVR